MERLTSRDYTYADHDFMENGIAPSYNKLAEYENAEESGELAMVVRCKDCKHQKYMYCINRDGISGCLKRDDYCSYGERRIKK